LAETPGRRFGGVSILVAAAGVGAALAAVVYLTPGEGGNAGADAACAAAPGAAAALDPLIGGEIAAFQLAREPRRHADLAFVDADGTPTSIAAFGGKVTLVNLWATWCAPCRAEMPALDRLQGALGGEKFAVVPVSIDTGDPARPAAFLKEIGVENLPLYTDRTTEIFQELKQRGLAIGLPVTLLLDENGCGLGHMNGPAEWDSAEGRALIEAAIAGAAAPHEG
jgi:thiol-disulfide isomerase/thioredoxin